MSGISGAGGSVGGGKGGNLGTQISGLGSQQKEIQANVQKVQEAHAANAAALKTTAGDVAGMKSSIGDQEKRIAKLEASVQDLARELKAAQAEIKKVASKK